ncbi:MAG: SDR family NAD(P)-dependent oxidoreductase [Ilumatobacteraceae bacterium]
MTGANSGIGLGAVRSLTRAGCDVVMACRNLARAEPVAETLRRENPAATIHVEELDLADLESVRSFVDRLAGSGRPVDVLMNNAGVMAVDRSTTKQGFEMQLGTKHL